MSAAGQQSQPKAKVYRRQL